MNLKKSDKIIAIVGVLILVIAAGIVIYTSTEEIEEKEPEEKLLTFDVIREEKTGTGETKTYTFEKKFLAFTKDVTREDLECVSIPYDNLKSVKFEVTYEDGKTSGLLGKLLNSIGGNVGKDTLTITVIDPDGTEHECEGIFGDGNTNITVDNINSPIYDDQIEAKTEDDARMELEDQYGSKWKGEFFGIKASLSSKEKWNLIWRLFEKFDSDGFTIEVTYTYCTYDLYEVEDNEDGENSSTGLESDQKTRNSAFWNNIMSCGRSWI